GDLFRSMTPATRLTTGLLLAVIVVSLVYLFRFQGTVADEDLLSGQSFSSAEISAMEAAFAKAGLSNYEVRGNRVRVPRGQKTVYVAALVDGNALPPDFNNFFTQA